MAKAKIGACRQDPKSKAVAIRTADNLPLPWAVMTIDQGGYHARDEDVEGWVDIPGTPVPDPKPASPEA